jgi:hypothetical protein
MVQIKRIKLGRRKNKCWQIIIIILQKKIPIIKFLFILCFLCSMLMVGIQLGLWISQFSMVIHDNAILASVVRNNNNNKNNKNNNGIISSSSGDYGDDERSNNNHGVKEILAGAGTAGTAGTAAAAGVTTSDTADKMDEIEPALVLSYHDDDVDDKLKNDVEQKLVKQFVQWINYPFLQELKGTTTTTTTSTDDDKNKNDEENDDYILEHHDGDDHLFTKFIYKAKRSNLLLQEGIKLVDEYNILKTVDTDIESLLEEVDLTYNIITKIITKLKQIVTYAETNGDFFVNGESSVNGVADGGGGGGGGADGGGNNKFPGRHHENGMFDENGRFLNKKKMKYEFDNIREIAGGQQQQQQQQQQKVLNYVRGQAKEQAQLDLNHIREIAVGQQQQQQHDHSRDSIIPDEDIRPLNEECNTKVSTINTIVFRGERHSGTKWIRSILEQNLKRSIYINQDDPKYGWKHGFLPPLGWGERIQSDTVLLLVVTRDVFTWLPKMYVEAYDKPTNKNRIKKELTFSQFIR